MSQSIFSSILTKLRSLCLLFSFIIFFSEIKVLLAASSGSRLLVLQISDFHANLATAPNLYLLLYQQIKEFQDKNPDEPILLLLNGDIAGLSGWSQIARLVKDNDALSSIQKGNFQHETITFDMEEFYYSFWVYKMFHEFSKIKNVQIVRVLGNHDEADFGQNNEVFKLSQNYIQKLGLDPSLLTPLTANLYPEEPDFYPPYTKTRFGLYVLGLTHPDYFRQSFYNPFGDAVFVMEKHPDMKARNTDEVLSEFIPQISIKDKEARILVATHAPARVIEGDVIPSLTRQKNAAQILPILPAGHNHKISITKNNDWWTVQAGAGGSFARYELSLETGKLMTPISIVDIEKEKPKYKNNVFEITEYLHEAQKFLRETVNGDKIQKSSRQLSARKEITYYDGTKMNAKQPGGTRVHRAYFEAITDYVHTKYITLDRDTRALVGLYDPSALYRKDTRLPVDFTLSDLSEAAPFNDSLVVLRMTKKNYILFLEGYKNYYKVTLKGFQNDSPEDDSFMYVVCDVFHGLNNCGSLKIQSVLRDPSTQRVFFNGSQEEEFNKPLFESVIIPIYERGLIQKALKRSHNTSNLEIGQCSRYITEYVGSH